MKDVFFVGTIINEIQKMIEDTYGIIVDRHSLYFYGRRCEKDKKVTEENLTPFLKTPKVS